VNSANQIRKPNARLEQRTPTFFAISNQAQPAKRAHYPGGDIFTTNKVHIKFVYDVTPVAPQWLLIQGKLKSGAPTVVNIPLPNPITASALSFDRVADLYDRVRCGYPDQLFDDIITFTGSSSLKRALEIGCASGQATRSLAARGFQIICVEPGNNFARLARQNLAEYKNVEVVCASFEDWTGNPQSFDLVFSANAIHWVDREIRVRKTAQILRPGGTLAIFRNFSIQNNSAIERAIRLAIGGPPPTDKEPKRWPRENEMRKSGFFDKVQKARYETSIEYDANAYVDLLSTRHRYNHVAPENRTEGFRKIQEIISDNGGTIEVRYVTQLLLARRKLRPSWWKRLLPSSDHRL